MAIVEQLLHTLKGDCGRDGVGNLERPRYIELPTQRAPRAHRCSNHVCVLDYGECYGIVSATYVLYCLAVGTEAQRAVLDGKCQQVRRDVHDYRKDEQQAHATDPPPPSHRLGDGQNTGTDANRHYVR